MSLYTTLINLIIEAKRRNRFGIITVTNITASHKKILNKTMPKDANYADVKIIRTL